MRKPCLRCDQLCKDQPDFCEAYIKYVNIQSKKRIKLIEKGLK